MFNQDIYVNRKKVSSQDDNDVDFNFKKENEILIKVNPMEL